jgi:DNA-binding CsgD family transcriptional regulator
MWILILVLNIIVFFAGFLWLNERLKSKSGLEDIVKKYRKEIDDVTLAFNSASADNIALLETRVEEIRNLTGLLDERIVSYKKTIAELEMKTRSAAREKLDRLNTMVRGIEPAAEKQEPAQTSLPQTAQGPRAALARKKPGKKDKAGQVLACFEDGLSVRETAEKLDISEEEVRFHLGKAHKL